MQFLVLYPFIDNISDPDYFNRKVVEYIEAQKIAVTMHRKTFEYANSFEDFLKMIQKSDDVDLLKRIRFVKLCKSCIRFYLIRKLIEGMTL